MHRPAPLARARRRRRALLTAAAALAALAVPIGAGAGPAAALPIGDRAQVSTVAVAPGSYSKGNPSAAYDADLDRYLIVWNSEQETAHIGQIWGRFVSPDGVPLGAPFKVARALPAASTDDARAFDARVAYSSKLRRYLVAFKGSVAPTDSEILYQWLDPQGTAIGATAALGKNFTLPDAPQLAVNDARGSITVVWHAFSDADTADRVMANVLTGTSVGPATRLTPADGGLYAQPTIAIDPSTGELAVASLDRPTTDGVGEVVVERFTPDLAPIGTGVRPLPLGTNPAHEVSIAWNAGVEQYAVAWTRIAGGDSEVWVARYDRTLQLVGAPTRISQMGPDGAPDYGAPDGLTISATGATAAQDQYGVFWVGDSSDASHANNQFEIWGRPLGPDLTPAAEQVDLSGMGPLPGTAVDTANLTNAVAYDTKRDRWLVPWSGQLAAGGGLQVFSRVFEPVRPAAVTATAPSPCPTSQAYVTKKKGTVCANAAAAKFSVGAAAKGGRLLRVLVVPTAKKQKISVRCVSRCARRHRTVRATAKRASTWVSVKAAGVKKRSTLEVEVSGKGVTTRYRRYTVLGKYPFLKATTGGCLVGTRRLAAAC
jgi:hypothetical protein